MSGSQEVGFAGAWSLFSLGYQGDMIAFFKLVEKYAVNSNYDDWDIITNRLYRHYIARKDWDRSIKLMEDIRMSFAHVQSSKVDWTQSLKLDTKLDISKNNLAAVFDRFFVAFHHIMECMTLEIEDGLYRPIKVVQSDPLLSEYFKQRTLEEYDAITGTPLWLRDDLGELKEKVYTTHYIITPPDESNP